MQDAQSLKASTGEIERLKVELAKFKAVVNGIPADDNADLAPAADGAAVKIATPEMSTPGAGSMV